VITKLDLAREGEVATLEARLASINRSAPVLHAVRGSLDAAALLDAGLYNGETRASDPDRWLRVNPERDADGRHRVSAARAVHDDGIRSFCLAFDEPLDWEAFAATLHGFIEERGRDVLRIKGIVNVASESRPVVVHGVQHVFYPPQSLARWPGDDRRSRVVFITSGIERATVERVFRDHHPCPVQAQDVGQVARIS
jgi:G3E family GTPase